MNVVFDLDGTICFKGQPIATPIAAAIARLAQAGHQPIFASARTIRDMLPVLPQQFHRYPLIGGNGSLIARPASGGRATVAAFAAEELQRIMQLIHEQEAAYLIDSEWDYAYTGTEDHPILVNLDPGRLARNVPVEKLGDIVKILVLAARDMEWIAAEAAKLRVVTYRHAGDLALDISPRDVDKWQALAALGFGNEPFIAFGNDANDLPLFRHARKAIRIGNHPALAPYAALTIPLDASTEQAIVAKVDEMAGWPI